MERWISVLGLLALMGIAYAFSKNRQAVNFRTIVWGVSLQLLLGVTILTPNQNLSFAGMFILVFLVVLYILGEEFNQRAEALGTSGPWVVGALILVGAGGAVGLASVLASYRINLVLMGIVALILAHALKRGHKRLPGFAFASLLIMGVGELISRGINGEAAFKGISIKVASFLQLSDKGADFLFAKLADRDLFFPGSETWPGFGFQFAFVVLPTIIFFSAFMSCMYYLGVVQILIGAMARFMRWSMKTSGSETMSCSANVFVGQTEAPFLIKPFIEKMTTSELHAVMVGGFATVAGGVLAGFIGMGVDAGHLIAASVMSAPAALVIAKLLLPETEKSETIGDVEMPEIQTADNLVEAAANGTTDGLKLALNVGAMLIAFISLVAVVDTLLLFLDSLVDGGFMVPVAAYLGGLTFLPDALVGWFLGFSPEISVATSEYFGFFPGSLKTLFGTLLRPLAFLMGVPWQDSLAVGNLLGVKLAVNEFVGYGLLSQHIDAGDLQPRSITIATYALCGFANLSSIGIQIGGISALAPGRRKDLAKIGVRAMMGGALASWMTATIAGILI